MQHVQSVRSSLNECSMYSQLGPLSMNAACTAVKLTTHSDFVPYEILFLTICTFCLFLLEKHAPLLFILRGKVYLLTG